MEAYCLSKEAVDLHINFVVTTLHYPRPLADHLSRDLLSDALQVAVPPTCTRIVSGSLLLTSRRIY
jgi:hypothetical protein